VNYYEYLLSDLWGKRRYAALERADFKCELCGEIDSLEVHHKTYERLGNEDPSDLVVMCNGHHWIEHIPKNVVVRIPSKAKECAYVIGISRKIGRLMDGYGHNWDILQETRDEIDRLEKQLSKHYRRGNCSVCPPIKVNYKTRPKAKKLFRKGKQERRALRLERKLRKHGGLVQ